MPGLVRGGTRERVELVTPDGRCAVDGLALPLLEATARLAIVPAQSLELLPASVSSWVIASKLALELVSRERVVPTILRHAGRIEARWAAALSASDDARNVTALAQSMPPASHAVPVAPGAALDVWAPDALLRAYLDAVVDALVRSAKGAPVLELAENVRSREAAPARWEERWQSALQGPEKELRGAGLRRTIPGRGSRTLERAGCRRARSAAGVLSARAPRRRPRAVRLALSPSVARRPEPARTGGGCLEDIGPQAREARPSLSRSAGIAARSARPRRPVVRAARARARGGDPRAARARSGQRPSASSATAPPRSSRRDSASSCPAELTPSGRRRLRLRMRVGSSSKVAGAVAGAAGLGLDALVAVDWQAAIGDKAITFSRARRARPRRRRRSSAIEARGSRSIPASSPKSRNASPAARPCSRCAKRCARRSPARRDTDRFRSRWRPRARSQQMLERLRSAPGGELDATRVALRDASPVPEARARLALDDGLARPRRLPRRRHGPRQNHTAPRIPAATRKYGAGDQRPALLVAPTSVVGNWEREIARFAPSLSIARHYGADRARSAGGLPASSRARSCSRATACCAATPSCLASSRLVRGRARRGAEHQERGIGDGAGDARTARGPSLRAHRLRRSRIVWPSSGRSSNLRTRGCSVRSRHFGASSRCRSSATATKRRPSAYAGSSARSCCAA